MSSTKSHRKKSRGIRSGDREGQGVDPPGPNYCSDNCIFKNVVTPVWMFGGAVSCLKHLVCLQTVGA